MREIEGEREREIDSGPCIHDINVDIEFFSSFFIFFSIFDSLVASVVIIMIIKVRAVQTRC